MERRTVPGRLSWQLGEVVAMQEETARAKSITLAVPHWNGHRPGQHVDVRLTAEDGYQAERSYSIASAPKPDQRVTLTVERIDDGEVSPYLTGELRVEEQMGGPLLLVAGGSGIVPLMAMIHSWAALGSTIPIRLLYSSRSYPEVIYRDELACLVKSNPKLEVAYTLTREQPPGWTGYHRRIDPEMLSKVAWPVDQCPLLFICGPTLFVETAATSLVALGYEPGRIKTERFGPTGET